MISNVTIGVTDPRDGDQNSYPNKGKIAINFVEFEKRHGKSTSDYLAKLQGLNWDLPGVEITVYKEQAGPPHAKPITGEITGDDFNELTKNAENVKKFINDAKVEGVDNLKSDFVSNKP